jgi:hypothetical protein
MNRRTFLKRTAGGAIALLGLSGGTVYYSREIEPESLHIQEEFIRSDKLPSVFHDKTIIHFSDTHVGFNYSIHDLDSLIAAINRRKPDMIVFTGDLIDDPKTLKETDHAPIAASLAKLDPPLGKYWIYGNHDHGGYGTEIIRSIMDQAGFILLLNSHTLITEDSSSIVLAGIDDLMLGTPDVEAALDQADSSLFTILLAHEPDFADLAVRYPIDVQLSGHSHGGQVRLPFIGHLYTPMYAEKYVLGSYLIDEKLQLFVNAGIGTTRIPYRLFCRPEIHEYTLTGKLS